MAAEDLRVSQISIRSEFVRMKRVNGGKLCSRVVSFCGRSITKKRERENLAEI